MTDTLRDIDKRLRDLEDSVDAGDDLADLPAGQVYMVMLRANAADDEEREARAWQEYQWRVEALATDAEDNAADVLLSAGGS